MDKSKPCKLISLTSILTNLGDLLKKYLIYSLSRRKDAEFFWKLTKSWIEKEKSTALRLSSYETNSLNYSGVGLKCCTRKRRKMFSLFFLPSQKESGKNDLLFEGPYKGHIESGKKCGMASFWG